MRARLALLVLLLAAAASAALAHDLFLKLDSYFLAPNVALRAPLLNGTFTRSENAVARDRVADVSVATAAGVAHPADYRWDATGDTTVLGLRTGAAGTYVIGVSVAPRELQLGGTEFAGYLREEGLTDVLAERRRAGELAKPARERYSKHVKAVVQVGAARDTAYRIVLGYAAELVPLANPYDVAVGGTLAFRALVDGRPLAGATVLAGVQRARERPAQRTFRTDSAGVVRVPITARGRWYVKFIRMTRVTGGPDASRGAGAALDYESKWATLTFGVR